MKNIIITYSAIICAGHNGLRLCLKPFSSQIRTWLRDCATALKGGSVAREPHQLNRASANLPVITHLPHTRCHAQWLGSERGTPTRTLVRAATTPSGPN